jgi:DNA-binding response OmpR family regulator
MRKKAMIVSAGMILSGIGALEEEYIGTGGGADDYLSKPFNFHDLEARVRALLVRGAS